MELKGNTNLEHQSILNEQEFRNSSTVLGLDSTERLQRLERATSNAGELCIRNAPEPERLVGEGAREWHLQFEGVSEDKIEELCRSKQTLLSNGNILYASGVDDEPPVVGLRGLFVYACPQPSSSLTIEQQLHLGTVPTNVNLPDFWGSFRVAAGQLCNPERLTMLRSYDYGHQINSNLEYFADDEGREIASETTRFLDTTKPHLAMQKSVVVPNFSGDFYVHTAIDGTSDHEQYAQSETEAIANQPVIVYAAETTKGDDVVLMQKTLVFDDEGSVMPAERVVSNDSDKISQGFVVKDAVANKQYTIITITSIHSSVDQEMIDGYGARPLQACQEDIEENIDCSESLARHKQEWLNVWHRNNISIVGDDDVQESIRFNMGHIMADAGTSYMYKYSGLGAKQGNRPGLGYNMHEFWDNDMFANYSMLPEQQRTRLEGRYQQLEAARFKAKQAGYEGAWWPWEAHFALDPKERGEGCPKLRYNSAGVLVEIKTLTEAIHISADVAYTAMRYYNETGDEDFLKNYGAEIVEEATRFLVSRATQNNQGKYEYQGVTGPDEYHENVTNNAYTVLMAAHTMQLAKSLTKKGLIQISEEEAAKWENVRNNLHIPFNEETLIFSAFDGYDQLEDIDLNDPRYKGVTNMDSRLQRERTPKNIPQEQLTESQKNPVKATKVIKQADTTLALLRLGTQVLDFLPAPTVERLVHKYGSRQKVIRNIYFANHSEYTHRTSNGSSLSPTSEVQIALEAGENPDDCYELFVNKVAYMDKHTRGYGNTHKTQDGLHTANAGEIARVVSEGFMGIKFEDGILTVNPRMPSKWDAAMRVLQLKGETVQVSVNPRRNEVIVALVDPSSNAQLDVDVAGRKARLGANNNFVVINADSDVDEIAA